VHEADPNGPSARIVAGVFGAVFVLLQLWTVDYGTLLNDAEPVRQFSFGPDTGAAIEARQERQETVIGGTPVIGESAEMQMLRFKLYSVAPDEQLSIKALRRIRPGRFDFNPDLFQYGGAYLYPLGLYYFALAKLGVIEVSSLDALLKSPHGLDRIFVTGRIFILIAFILSAWVLYRTFRLVADPWTATWAIGLYLFAPGSIMYSIMIKPHWYWLLWLSAALYVMTRGWVRGHFAFRDEVLLGLFIGLSVGAAPFNVMPALLAGAALLVAIGQGIMRRSALFRVPLVAVLFAVLTNPYFVVGWQQMFAELKAIFLMPAVAGGAGSWTTLSSSLPFGFGFALVAVVIGLGLYRLFARKGPMTWYAAASLVVVAVAIGYVAADNPSSPVVFFRFVSYLLPIALLLVVHRPWPYRGQVMALALVLTVVQSIPTKTAQIDADDPIRGTRFAAAAWVEAQLPAGTSLCPVEGRVGPGKMPPVDYVRYPTPEKNCDYLVGRSIGRDIDDPPPGYRLTVDFEPRLWTRDFVLLYGFANPYFAIYQRTGRPETPDPQ
jgi:hypothetical protein